MSTKPATRWQIYLKGKPVAVEPSTYWPTQERAENQLHKIEHKYFSLRGQLEVRPVENRSREGRE